MNRPESDLLDQVVALSVCLSGHGTGDMAAMSPGYSAQNWFVMTECPGGSGGLGMSEGAESPAALQVRGDQCVCACVCARARACGRGVTTGQPLTSEAVDLIGQKKQRVL